MNLRKVRKEVKRIEKDLIQIEKDLDGLKEQRLKRQKDFNRLCVEEFKHIL